MKPIVAAIAALSASACNDRGWEQFPQQAGQEHSVVLKEEVYINTSYRKGANQVHEGVNYGYFDPGRQKRIAVLKRGSKVTLLSRRTSGGSILSDRYTVIRCRSAEGGIVFDYVAGVDGKINQGTLPW